LFGSRAGKIFRPSSDIDVGFIAKHKLGQRLFNGIREALDESIIPYHIDLVDFGTADKEFKNIALKKN